MVRRALDRSEARKIYWSQKGPDNAGRGPHLPSNLEIPAGETPAKRTDIEIFFDALPEPIDLELDHDNRVMYWTTAATRRAATR